MAYTSALTVCSFVLLSKVKIADAVGLVRVRKFHHNVMKMFLVLQYENNKKTSKSCADRAREDILSRLHALTAYK